ncbi:MAG: VanZ family protein, partial [Thermodesulfobacteriota bacterium]
RGVNEQITEKVFKRGELRLFWLPLVAYMGLIFYLSSRPDLPDVMPGLTFGDKVAHLAAYALLAVLWVRALEKRWTAIDEKRLFIIAVLCTGLYGISDEIHQYFVPGRSADFLDAIADIAGGMVGARLSLRFMRGGRVTGTGEIKGTE